MPLRKLSVSFIGIFRTSNDGVVEFVDGLPTTIPIFGKASSFDICFWQQIAKVHHTKFDVTVPNQKYAPIQVRHSQ